MTLICENPNYYYYFYFFCHVENVLNKKAAEIAKPDFLAVDVAQPVERKQPEPPQIKGPVDEAEEKKEEEEVQLDRPDAGKTKWTETSVGSLL